MKVGFLRGLMTDKEVMRLGNEVRNIQKTFLMNKSEAKDLAKQAAAEGISEGKLIRLRIRNKPCDYADIRIMLRDIMTELNRLGTNINQIVKNNNSGLYLPSDKDRLLAYMQRLSSSMAEVVNKLGNN